MFIGGLLKNICLTRDHGRNLYVVERSGTDNDRDIITSRGSGKPMLLFDARRVLLLCFTQHVQNLI